MVIYYARFPPLSRVVPPSTRSYLRGRSAGSFPEQRLVIEPSEEKVRSLVSRKRIRGNNGGVRGGGGGGRGKRKKSSLPRIPFLFPHPLPFIRLLRRLSPSAKRLPKSSFRYRAGIRGSVYPFLIS